MIIAVSVLLASSLIRPPVTPPLLPPALGGYGQSIIYVDDDDIGDPGPGNPLISNPLEDGSQYYPFDSVQEAMDRCLAGDMIQIEAGLYRESLRVVRDGCRMVGRGQGATVIEAPSPDLLTRYWYQDGAADLGLEQLTLRGGRIDIGQHTWQSNGVVHLADVSLESVSLIAVGIDSSLTLDLNRVAGTGGRVVFGSGSYGNTVLQATRLVAPDTRIEWTGGSTTSHGSMELFDSAVRGIAMRSPDEGFGRAALRRVVIGSDGIVANVEEFGFELRVEDSEIGGPGLTINTGASDIDTSGLHSEVHVERSRFTGEGLRYHAAIEPTFLGGFVPSRHLLQVEGCQFSGGGVTVSLAGGHEDTGGFVQLRMANNVFRAPGTGLVADFEIVDSAGLPTGRIESNLEIVNNTFSGNDTGIKLTTSPHTPGLHALTTLIKNNIIAGGRTGIEVHGLDDHTIAIENNDVLGRPDARYKGDLRDQTGLNGNISLPPWFAGPTDLRLQKISPCIDRGGSGPEVPSTDINGLARPQDGNGDSVIAPDMGAHERPGPIDRPGVTLRKP